MNVNNCISSVKCLNSPRLPRCTDTWTQDSLAPRHFGTSVKLPSTLQHRASYIPCDLRYCVICAPWSSCEGLYQMQYSHTCIVMLLSCYIVGACLCFFFICRMYIYNIYQRSNRELCRFIKATLCQLLMCLSVYRF